MGVRKRAGGGERHSSSANRLELYPPLTSVTNSPGMHPIAQHLPVGPLITPFTIIIASITHPDTRKKTVKSGIVRRKKYPTAYKVAESGEGQRERYMGDSDKETEQETGEKFKR